MSVNAQNIVARLLEDDEVDVDHYMGMVNTGSVEDVLAMLGFKADYHNSWRTRVPLEHTDFPTAFDHPNEYGNARYVEVHVGPCHKRRSPDDPQQGIHQDDHEAVSYKMSVSFLPEHLYIAHSRDCIAGQRGTLGARLNHVVRFLIDAIHKVDAEKHTDLYKFACAIDKAWGKQPNRIIRRKKPISATAPSERAGQHTEGIK